MPDTSSSDAFAAWIGLAGVAVGAILSGGIDWWRSHITEGKERRREIGRAADDLGAGANSLKVAAGAFALADMSRQSLIAARPRPERRAQAQADRFPDHSCPPAVRGGQAPRRRRRRPVSAAAVRPRGIEIPASRADTQSSEGSAMHCN